MLILGFLISNIVLNSCAKSSSSSPYYFKATIGDSAFDGSSRVQYVSTIGSYDSSWGGHRRRFERGYGDGRFCAQPHRNRNL